MASSLASCGPGRMCPHSRPGGCTVATARSQRSLASGHLSRTQHRASALPSGGHGSSQESPRSVAVEEAEPCSTAWNALGATERMLWTGTAEEASACGVQSTSPLCDPKLPPLWKVLILSDGSVTRHLQILTGCKVEVDCLSMVDIGDALSGLPANTEMIPGPRVQRQVLLRAGPRQAPLVYASSWWNSSEVDTYLSDRSKPIWVSLSQEHVELYREVQHVYFGNNTRLKALLGCEGPFWGRSYIFWHNARPLCLIYEVFSNRLQDYLGPSVA